MRGWILAACVSLLPACAGETSRLATTTVRDSAGIRIVENPALDSASMTWWAVEDSPALQIGAADATEAEILHQVRGAARLSGGRIAVATRTDVRYFSADGSHLLTAGRQGSGPGEFGDLTSLLRAGGDTLWAFDYRRRRVSVLGPQGKHVREFEIGGAIRPGEAIGRYPDGGLLGVNYCVPERPPEGVIHRVRVCYGVSIPGTARYDTIGIFPYHDELITMRGDARAIGPPAYGRTTAVAHHDEDFYVGTQEAPEIRVYSRDGRLTRMIRTGVPMLPVTPERIEEHFLPRFLQRLSAESREGAAEPLRERFLRGPFAEFVPPYGDIHTDTGGSLWVSDYDAADEPALWTVYDPEGQALARARLPEGIQIYEIGPDYVLGGWRGELRIEYVRVYRLDRS